MYWIKNNSEIFVKIKKLEYPYPFKAWFALSNDGSIHQTLSQYSFLFSLKSFLRMIIRFCQGRQRYEAVYIPLIDSEIIIPFAFGVKYGTNPLV